MKMKVIIGVLAFLVVAGAVGGFFYYDKVLRFEEGFTDCPITAFRTAVTAPAAGKTFATEAAYGSLSKTEKCGRDCLAGNATACAVYGMAIQYGVFVLKNADEAKKQYDIACTGGATIGCTLSKYVDELAEEAQRAMTEEAQNEVATARLEAVQEAKGKATQRKKQALAHFKGTGPMLTAAMVKSYEGTVQYVLYGLPRLCQKNTSSKAPALPENLDLKAFLLAKYVDAGPKPRTDELLSFLREFHSFAIEQVKFDSHLGDKAESDLLKTHPFFNAKNNYLYHEAEVMLEVLGEVEKRLQSKS